MVFHKVLQYFIGWIKLLADYTSEKRAIHLDGLAILVSEIYMLFVQMFKIFDVSFCFKKFIFSCFL